MKKLMLIVMCLLLSAALMLNVSASEPKVVLVSGASYTAGSTLTVDIQKMTEMDARIYNAWLEGTVQYQWYSGENPIAGATGKSYTIASGDKSLVVKVTCGDLELTSTRYLVTSVGIVVTRKTTTPTTAAPTTKASTTKATTKATTAPTQDPGVMIIDEPAGEPVNEPTTVPTTAPTTAPTTVSTTVTTTIPPTEPVTQTDAVQQTGTDVQASQTEESNDEFPWWTVVLVVVVALAIIAAAAVVFRKKK